jgi:hypothetical protein
LNAKQQEATMIGKVSIYLTAGWMAQRSPEDEEEEERMHDLEVDALTKICEALTEGVPVDVFSPDNEHLYTLNTDG